MADEIKVTMRLECTNANYTPGPYAVNAEKYTQTAQGEAGGVISVGTSEEALPAADLTTKGWLIMTNLDATNYVEWGTTGAYVGKMEAGESAFFRTGGAAAPYLKANTAACNVWYRWLED